MGHGDVLTQEEYSTIKLNTETLRYLEMARKKLGLEMSEVRIMDWGCGRGTTILKLLELGYPHVRGVEIDESAIDRGRDFFTKRGLNPDDYMTVLDESGRCQFRDGMFNYFNTNQVFEHFRYIETTVSEISRITKSGGYGLHIFPAPRQPIEGHLYMPFIHWLPKNELRRKMINAWSYVGVEPHWSWNDGQPRHVRVKRYNDFSFDQTFYRRSNEVKGVFERYGLHATNVSIDHPSVKGGVIGKMASLPILRDGLEWAILTFKMIEILTVKNSAR